MKARRTTRKSKEESAFLEKLGRWLSEGAAFCVDIHDRCEENQRYLRGEQWSEGDMNRQAERERPTLSLNKVLPALNAIANREIMQRYSPKAYGRTDGDGGWANIVDEFMRWQRDGAESEHEESLAFRSAVASGYSCVHKYWDPLEDGGEGKILDEEIPIWWMIWDSRARKQNLIDRRWHVCGKYVPKEDAEAQFGDLSPRNRSFFRRRIFEDRYFEDMRAGSSGAGRWPWEHVAQGKYFNRADEEIFLLEAEWREITTIYQAAEPIRFAELAELVTDPEFQLELEPGDPEQGTQPVVITHDQYHELEPQQQAQLRTEILAETRMVQHDSRVELDRFADRYFDITDEEFEDWNRQQRYTYKYAIATADHVLEMGERPQGFTYEFITGFPFPTREQTTYFGFVDLAKGPQDWRNTFMSLILTRLQMSPKQTILVEEDAVDDIDEFFDQMANPRGVATVRPGFVASNKYMTLQPPRFPDLERELIRLADQGVSEQAGLSGIDIGQQADLRRVSGNVVQSVKEASNTILAILFDAYRRYRKRSGLLAIRYMYEFYGPEEVLRIVGEEKAPDVPDLSQWQQILRFDIKVDEAPTSVTERMQMIDFLTRTGTLQQWVAEGQIPFEVALEWFTPMISEMDKRQILDHRKQRQEQQNKFAQLSQFLEQNEQGAAMLAEFEGQQQDG